MNGFASKQLFIEAFYDYMEYNPEWENEWAYKLLDAYKNFGRLSEKQWFILSSIAEKIKLKPGWREDKVDEYLENL